MSVVYWIHLSTHTDCTKQGYVGVTTKTAVIRFREHYTNYLKVKKSSIPALTLHKCFEKYGLSGLEISVLYEGREEDCYAYEYKLRPTENIGWNMARGGKQCLK